MPGLDGNRMKILDFAWPKKLELGAIAHDEGSKNISFDIGFDANHVLIVFFSF